MMFCGLRLHLNLYPNLTCQFLLLLTPLLFQSLPVLFLQFQSLLQGKRHLQTFLLHSLRQLFTLRGTPFRSLDFSSWQKSLIGWSSLLSRQTRTVLLHPVKL
ncbi:hypothetical protein DIPPA_55173 [Diplonema papillatum]|nr:hypothetical protein DIPPA_65218 [Diplonema papillatum]KAJ9447555.1 hypothetical protein DIPPA_54364 [Diplonema papillatum]KAJ9452464.1 hypothetical protein DIPPA_55173 [Diplonema papillatum]